MLCCKGRQLDRVFDSIKIAFFASESTSNVKTVLKFVTK